MAIKTICPKCDAAYAFADAVEGKQVRCMECAETFIVDGHEVDDDGDLDLEVIGEARLASDTTGAEEVASSATRARRALAEEDRSARGKGRISDDEVLEAELVEEEEDDRHVPGKRLVREADDEVLEAEPVEEEDDDRPSRGKRRVRDDDDDEEDEDEAPARRRRRFRDDEDDDEDDGSERSTRKVWIIGASAATLVLVAGLGWYFIAGPGADVQPKVADPPAKVAQHPPNDPDKPARESVREVAPGNIPLPDKDKLPLLAAQLHNLKAGDDEAKALAVTYFAGQDPVVPERQAVAKALEALLGAPRVPADLNRAFTAWATRDQVPALVKLIQKDTGAAHNALAMQALGRLKEDSGVDALVHHLGDTSARAEAFTALKDFGPAAESGLIRNRFHKNDATRQEVTKLLGALATPADKICPQAVKDLASPDDEARNAAAAWLAETGVNESYRKDVARGLEGMLAGNATRPAALKTMQIWISRDNVPALVDLLGQANVPGDDILRLLARLKDERAAPAIAARLVSERETAADALRALGPSAVPSVVPYVNHADVGAHTEARRLLKEWNVKEDVLLTQALKDLANVKDGSLRKPALGYLAEVPVNEALRGKVGKAIEPLLGDAKLAAEAYRAFFHWAGRDNLPTLLKVIVNEESPHRREAMEAAAKCKDERAALAIASRLLTKDRTQASKALKSMGPIAERSVVPFLSAKDASVRIEVLHILREVGTRASIPFVMQAMKADPKNKNLVKAAQEAGAAMQGR